MTHDPLRYSAARGRITDTDDSKAEPYHTVEGLVDETFTEVMRVQQHGFSSHPPKNSHGILLPLFGQRDMAVFLGGEGASRKGDLAEGDAAVYNGAGSYFHLEGANPKLNASGNLTITVASVTFVCGGQTLTFDGSGLKHNGVNIGATHTHDGVTTGADKTGVPSS